MKKTEKKITRGEKVMAIAISVLIVLSGISLYLFFAERAKAKNVEAGKGISQAVFTRTGAVVELEEISDVESVEVFDSEGTLMIETEVGKNALFVLNDFKWTPFLKYRFDVKLKDGSLLSTPAYAPDKPQPYKIFSINYDSEFPREEDGNHGGIAQGASIQNVVDISEDGKYIAMAMQKGRIGVVDIEAQKEIWSSYIDKMKWRNMKISSDSKYLTVGGTHPDAPIYVFNLRTGAEVWHYDCIQDLGAYEDTVANARTTVTQVGSQYVRVASTFGWTEMLPMTRSWSTMEVNESLMPQYRSHIYCFELASGKKVWDYPKANGKDDDWGDGMINKNINGLMVNTEGKQYVLIQTQARTPQPDTLMDWISVLDAKDGTFKWRYDVPIIPMTTHSSIYSSFISPNGNYIVIGPEDGRVIFFENEKCISLGYGSPSWVLNQGMPQNIDGVKTHAGGGNNVITDGKFVYTNPGITFDEFGPENRAKNGLLYGRGLTCVYNLKGELVWYFEGRLPAGGGNLENQNVDLRCGFITTTFTTAGTMSAFPKDDKNSMSYAYSIFPTEGLSVLQVLDLSKGGSAGINYFCWSFTTRAKFAEMAGGRVSLDGTYVAFLTCPMDYSPTGTPETHNIQGYYELFVYT